MPVLEVSTKEIEYLIKQLDTSARQELLRRLERETISQEWDKLLEDIDKRLKKRRIALSEEGIIQEVEAVRQRRYERTKD